MSRLQTLIGEHLLEAQVSFGCFVLEDIGDAFEERRPVAEVLSRMGKTITKDDVGVDVGAGSHRPPSKDKTSSIKVVRPCTASALTPQEHSGGQGGKAEQVEFGAVCGPNGGFQG